ncbi:protein FAM83B [Gadus morhua]|uniref:protein FAM83B n=1 Tax=Gadus morhua TaxID=8049 RepID=UPI0011B4015B|nr:protein FAM83B-like [Gadus morhua]
MESSLSCVSSLKEDVKPCFIQPHYKESYRLAIYALLCGGTEAYDEFLKAEQISHFLSDEEILYVLENAELPVSEDGGSGKTKEREESHPSTYFPTESDEQVPDLDLGWPEVSSTSETNISLLFHPPRQNTPTIKEVVRKQILDAKQLIAISMDVFTDVDIFQELVSASRRGVIVYILLDHTQFHAFLHMSQRLGVNIKDLQNLRVRTVSGPQYQCQSGAKFSGALEQRFILVDCRTVLYGTYSYTWSFEKINLSMVLVVTGQLVGSYDEEFRRLYARSVAPTELTSPTSGEEDGLKPLFSPSSSLLSLHRPRMTNGLMMTRGISMQEKLHQSHRLDPGQMVRGHSYGELQRLNSSSTRLKAAEGNGTTQQGGEDPPTPPQRPARMSQLLTRHRMRYGSDQNLIPFNSETSLNRWKIDSYFSHEDETPEAAYDVTSPQGSLMNLNEGPHQKSRHMKSRLEEIRLKRLSLQEYTRQSQENLRPMFSTQERSRMRSSLRTLDKSQSMAALEEHSQQESSGGAADYENVEYFSPRLKPSQETPEIEECPETEEPQALEDQPSAAQRKRPTPRTQDRPQPLPRTPSSGGKPDVKQKEPSLKPLGLRPSGGNTQSSRALDPLLDIPEEKDATNKVDSTDKLAKVTNSPGHKDPATTTPRGGRRAVSRVGSVASIRSVGSRHQDLAKESTVATKKDPPGARPSPIHAEPPPKREATLPTREATPPKREATPPLTANSSICDASGTSQNVVKAKGSAEKVPSPQGEQTFQRKNSLKSKVYSLLGSQRKEDKTLQRKSSMRSQNPSPASQQASVEGSDGSVPSAAVARSTVAPATPKGTLKSVSRSQYAIDSLEEKERPSSVAPFDRGSAQRSSRPQTSVSGSRQTLESDGAVDQQPQRARAYSRFEPLLDKPVRSSSLRYLGKERNSVLNSIRQPSAGASKNNSANQTPTTQDNRLGRFMQRVGSLITKNK